ncbi:MAG TPA: hypothetical protein VGS80_25825 [Ktedonobacterales bacterium]|nr:hypothetical protein [Ktedonobacterales bacterium]
MTFDAQAPQTKLTRALRQASVRAVRRGDPLAAAADDAGISETTLHRWRRIGRHEPHSPDGVLVVELEWARVAYLASERAPRRPLRGAPARDLAVATAFLEPPATAPVSGASAAG